MWQSTRKPGSSDGGLLAESNDEKFCDDGIGPYVFVSWAFKGHEEFDSYASDALWVVQSPLEENLPISCIICGEINTCCCYRIGQE